MAKSPQTLRNTRYKNRAMKAERASVPSQTRLWISRLMAQPAIAPLYVMFGFFDVMFTLNDLWHGATTLLSMVS